MSDLPGAVETFPDLEQRTPEWYAVRCGIITASAIGKLITARTLTAIEYRCPACDAPPQGACMSKTRIGQENKTLHAERTALATAERCNSPVILEPADTDEARSAVLIATAERVGGFVDKTFQSIDMMRGVDEEPLAVDAYAEHKGVTVVPCGFMTRRWSSDRPSARAMPGDCTLGYSPDGLVGDDGLIEIKSRRGKKQVETVLAGAVPAENMAQIMAGLFVSGRAWCDYVSYSAGLHLYVVRVYPDERWFDAIRAAVESFERDVTRTVDAYLAAVDGLPLTERIPDDIEIGV